MSSEIDNRVSYDQYDNIPTVEQLGINAKIIFSEETYLKLLEMINQTRNLSKENGCFFVGTPSKNDSFNVYINYSTSQFDSINANVGDGAVLPSDSTYQELINQISTNSINNKKSYIFHFHTHFRSLFYESFSDQDLSMYAKMAFENSKYPCFGILGFPVPNSNLTNGISIVQPVKPQKNGKIGVADFFMYSSIYYCVGNSIFKVGSFEKSYVGRKTYGSSNVVRNKIINSDKKRICGLGIDPNTGEKIEDEQVGYIDVNNYFCFPGENLSLQFGFPCKEHSEFER